MSSKFNPIRFVKDHWAGENSIAASVLLAGAAQIAVAQLAYLVIGSIFDQSSVQTLGPTSPFCSVVLYTILTLPVFVWWLTGIVKSGVRVGRQRNSWGWSALAFVLVAVFAAAEGYSIITVSLPTAVDAGEAVLGDPQWGSHYVQIADDGHELLVTGFISWSLVADVKDELSRKSGIKTVALSSVGGRVEAARQLASIVKSYNLSTVVYDRCISACTTVFLAGKTRLMARNAKLAFHSFYVESQSDSPENEQANEQAIKDGISTGIDPSFLARAHRHRESLWYPTLTELMAARVVTGTIEQRRHPPGSRGSE